MGDVEEPEDPLSPGALTRTLGTLVLAEAMVVDALRGRPFSAESSSAVREALAGARRVAAALDQDRKLLEGEEPAEPEPTPQAAPDPHAAGVDDDAAVDGESR